MGFSEETRQKVRELRLIDDLLFRKVAERKDVCQEILRTLLDNEDLEVISVTPQDELVGFERSVILDVLCRTSDGTLCNIEVQKGHKNDDRKRVRFHASMLTVKGTPSGAEFKDIPNVTVLYISEYDALGNGKTLTHIARFEDTKDCIVRFADGEDIYFANTAVKDETKHTELLQLFLRSDAFENENFQGISNARRERKLCAS